MDIEELQTFVEVADAGGISQAALRLGVSKSIVSRRLARLEAELGVQLLARSTRGASLTEAGATFRDYAARVCTEIDIARETSTVGIDFSRYDLDEPIVYQHSEAGQSALEAFTRRSPGKVWTVRKLLEAMPLGSRILTLVGDGSLVADELCAWQQEADIDGFNLIRSVAPQSVRDFIRWVVPELQTRGVYKTTYATGTLREKLFGGAAHLPSTHYGASLRSP
ncbi:alkanesulfonate monooxygenase SsuD/methylene tetrahydromethanopterin reductase-like flavin-dependent oxidoreductase (luciferase family) [Pseudomonas sp. W3I7]|uniref:LysR family transcriptional regulator n=1 Tax=Pseudomonas sp. W3I7 TaxID=3042292 RepID=UPI0027927E6B|nr:LysR family transcriptional regulator [Pseudomonas sp. W3I7]MDQ0703983.1 alkanesulfonate monooxygenase SsuD/methylene tetrahydromethanopterin reductase-like flavin-dependent oxidoreductase (luciferase family) [Pseudomonas sp. W3I7]